MPTGDDQNWFRQVWVNDDQHGLGIVTGCQLRDANHGLVAS